MSGIIYKQSRHKSKYRIIPSEKRHWDFRPSGNFFGNNKVFDSI